MIARIVPALVLGTTVAGCGGPAVDPAVKGRAEQFALGEMRPLPLAPIASWYADDVSGGMVCGEIEAPRQLRAAQSSLRYFYSEPNGRPTGQVEQHAGVIATDATSSALLTENRTLFGAMWAEHCQPFAPIGRRLGGWFGTSPDTGSADTPLTNAHVDAILNSRQ